MRRSPALPSGSDEAPGPRARRVSRVAPAAGLALAAVGALAATVPAASATAGSPAVAPVAAVSAGSSAAVRAAAPALGSTVLILSPSAARSLRAPGIGLAPAGEASGSARLVGMAVASVGSGSRPRIGHAPADGVRFRVGSRSVLLRDLRVTLSGKARIDARIGGSRVAALALRNVQARGSAETARTFTARVSLTAAGARRLRTGLRIPRLRAGSVGTLRIGLTAPASSGAEAGAPKAATPVKPATPAAPGVPAGTPGSPGAPTTPGAPSNPGTPMNPGDPGTVNPGAPGTPDPTPETTAPSLDWTVRSSWLSYLAGGNGTATADGGATRTATGSFLLPTAGGTVDAAGVGTIEQTGSVRFRQAGHGIDMEYSAFVVHLDGTTRPRVTALYTDRNTTVGGAPIEIEPGDGTGKRIELGTLDLAEPSVTITREGGQYVVRRAPILLSAEAAKPYSFYKEGDAFGAMTLRAPLGS